MRFRFGQNWRSYAEGVGSNQIADAEKSLVTLLGTDDLSGLSFLDIGSGSGLFSLAARRFGATVHSFDFDKDSVLCTRTLRDRFRPADEGWTIEEGSILDKDYLSNLGRFDIVYSWGVLHHTGAMWTALQNATSLLKPSGLLTVALYRRTPMCGVWQAEKRFYSGAPAAIQAIVRGAYKAALVAELAVTGRNPLPYIRGDKSGRGMNFHHNVQDWLGGYPYESASPAEVRAKLSSLGLTEVRSFESPPGLGLFGTGCDEFVWRSGPAEVAKGREVTG